MKKIKKIKLMGMVLLVVETKDLNDGVVMLYGQHVANTHKIEMNPIAKGETYITTLLHEILHVGESILDIQMSESEVKRFSILLLSLIRDNPKLVELIIN